MKSTIDALRIAEKWMKFAIEDTEWHDGAFAKAEHAKAKEELATVRAVIASVSDERPVRQALEALCSKLAKMEVSRMICAADMVELFELGRALAQPEAKEEPQLDQAMRERIEEAATWIEYYAPRQ